MNGKPLVESKTIIVNTIVALVIFFDYIIGSNISQWLSDLVGVANIEVAVLSIVNIALRLVTHTGINRLM